MILSLKDTQNLKGIALLILLAHHLFFNKIGLYDDVYIAGHGVVNQIGIWSKVCVAIFVLLSGFGLVVSERNRDNPFEIKRFYTRRFTKLMINYWVVWVIFVSIDLFFFRSFQDVYHSQIIPKVLLDFLGVSRIVGAASFNPTWWFIACILVLYLLAPQLYKILVRSNIVVLLCLSIALSYLPIVNWQATVGPYLFTFSCGMVLGYYPIHNNKNMLWMGGAFLLLSIERLICENYYFALLFDSSIAIMVACMYNAMKIFNILGVVLSYLGKHSMNIFMFHTFLIQWFRTQLYGLYNPLLIYVAFLTACLVISETIELIKKMLYTDKLIEKICSLR